jgi:hypothetical protein
MTFGKILKQGVFLSACLASGIASAQSSVKLSKVPVDDTLGEKIRANLGNAGYGTRVDGSIAQTVPVSSDAPKAISPDTMSRVELPTGESFNAIDLPRSYTVNRIYFKSYGAAGTVSVSTSLTKLEPGDPNWVELFPPAEFGSSGVFDQEFPVQVGKHLLFKFEITIPGAVSPFGIKGNEFINRTASRPPTAAELDELTEEEKSNLVPYDFSSLVNGSRITMISSGDSESANLMIDDDITTFYQFNEDDPSSTLLLDLTQNYRVNSLGLTMDAGIGEIEVYTFDILPSALAAAALEGAEGTGEVQLDAEFFASVFPLVTQSFDEAVENVAFDLGEVDTQYALVRWIPSPDVPPGSQPGLKIYEIKLIGMIPSNLTLDLLSSAEFFQEAFDGGGAAPTPPPAAGSPPDSGEIIQPAPPPTPNPG